MYIGQPVLRHALEPLPLCYLSRYLRVTKIYLHPVTGNSTLLSKKVQEFAHFLTGQKATAKTAQVFLAARATICLYLPEATPLCAVR